MIYSRNLGLHFSYLSLSFKVIFSLSNWQIQGSYDASKKDYESISWSLVCTTFLKAPLHSFSLWFEQKVWPRGCQSSYLLRDTRDIFSFEFNCTSAHCGPAGSLCPPGHCECSMWMRRACTFPAYLCAPPSHRLRLQTPPERQNQKFLDDGKEQSIKPSLHSEHQSWATTPSTCPGSQPWCEGLDSS